MEAIDARRHRNADAVASAYASLQPPNLAVTEHAVVRLLAEDILNKETARILDISVRTVESHRATVMRKLGTRSNTAVPRGLTWIGSTMQAVAVVAPIPSTIAVTAKFTILTGKTVQPTESAWPPTHDDRVQHVRSKRRVGYRRQ